ncbi:MAG: WXG100 family type VII secretion target [Ilumatobacteraceae bacterium]
MALVGADPEQLAALGRTMRQQMSAIDAVIASVSSSLAGTAWTGPARDRFEHDWNDTFRTALTRLVQAFDAAGGDCVARSTELLRVMGTR